MMDVGSEQHEKSGPTAGETEQTYSWLKEHGQLQAKNYKRKTGCGRQTAGILVQEGSQPRYGRGT